ncbi:hypothetical protein EBZ02_09070 [bacterium]|nr:hypothetical protein [bacterium]
MKALRSRNFLRLSFNFEAGPRPAPVRAEHPAQPIDLSKAQAQILPSADEDPRPWLIFIFILILILTFIRSPYPISYLPSPAKLIFILISFFSLSLANSASCPKI